MDLVLTKDVTPAFDRKYGWTIEKSVDKTTANLYSASDTATFNDTVKVSHDSGTNINYRLAGTITVFNPYSTITATGVNVTDAINDPYASCAVTGGTNQKIAPLDTLSVAHSCAYSAPPVSNSETTTATATWTPYGSPNSSASFNVPFTFPSNPANIIDGSVTVTDSYAGNLGAVCYTDASPKTFTYSRTIGAPTAPPLCVSYDNHQPTRARSRGTSAGRTTSPARRRLRRARFPPTIAPGRGAAPRPARGGRGTSTPPHGEIAPPASHPALGARGSGSPPGLGAGGPT